MLRLDPNLSGSFLSRGWVDEEDETRAAASRRAFAEFDESKVSRDESGRFGTKDGGDAEESEEGEAERATGPMRGTGDDIPPEPGTIPIPEGTVRLYHYTMAEGIVDKIADQGILQSKALGDTYGEPSVVWASAEIPKADIKEFVEFYARPDELDIGRDRTPEDIEARKSNVTMMGDVNPEQIVAIHKPWQNSYRYIEDSPLTQEWIRDGTIRHNDMGDSWADKAVEVWAKDNDVTLLEPDEEPRTGASRFSRRAYVEFDESKVRRDTGGRFSSKDDEGSGEAEGEAETLEAFRNLDIDLADMKSLEGLKDKRGVLITDKIEKNVAENFGTREEIEGRYDALIEQAKESGLFEQGKGWYDSANADAVAQAEKYGVPLDDVVGTYAAISPGLAWEDEKDIVDAMLDMNASNVDMSEERLAGLNAKLADYGLPAVENGTPYADLDERSAVMAMRNEFMERPLEERPHGWGARYGYGSFMEGLSIMRGADPDEALNGVKIRSFYNNIADPDGEDVTVDVMMMRAASGDPKFNNDSSITANPAIQIEGKKTEIGPTPYLADVVRDVADENGLTPAQAQAIIWLQWKQNTGTL